MFHRRGSRLGARLATLLLLVICLMPSLAYAEDSGDKVVRVGWYESAFHTTDSYGRKSGYGYEYQQRIATYTDWEYEYVEGSWPDLLAMLIDGDLDLLSDVSYTPERAEKILYSAEPMGSEGYHVFITPDNTEIRPNDLTTLNGKRIGVNQNSIQEQILVVWANERGLTPEIVELTEKSPVLFDMLATGQLDALVTLDTYGTSADVVPVVKIGSAESYFGINKGRPDLKLDLDAAMSRILEEDRDFNQRLAEQFNRSSTVNSFLTAEELDWLGEHSAIRVGYRDDFLPFCSLDKDAHELTGTLADFLAFAQHCEKNADLDFETHAFATTEEAFDALAAGEIDCLFPVSLSSYDGEQLGATISDPLVSTEMYAAVRTADQQGISADTPMRVAVMSGIPSYLTFLEDHFPDWTPIFCDGVEEGLKMVADGAADCMFVSNYRINYLSELLDRYGLSPLATGEAMNMSFAVRRNDDCLYSILNKAIRLFPTSTANATLTTHSFRNEHVTFAEFLRDNLVYVICAVSIITVIILALLLKGVRSEKRAEEGRQIISEAERDPLTGLYTWNFFLVYANRLYRYDPEHPMDAVVMNIDRFHQINALHGREFGDKVLYELGDEIRRFLETAGGIASRFESDRFDIYCEHRDDWPKQFARFQARLDAIQHNASIHLRMGVKPWQEAMEPIQLFDRARTACNSVRGDYTARVVVYDDAMGEREERDQRLLMDLPRAIENRELEVYYQPKYAIQTEVPTLSSAEALIRWKHPDLGLIPPGEFIDLFEHSGQIGELDRYVWAEASRQIAAWRDEFGHTLPVSVNLSRVDVFDETLQDTLEGLVERYGLAHGDLKLEVTESAYTENADQLIVVISKLRSRGFEIEMDDFGSGFSSLNMLSSMPIDILKMDMAFIRNMERDERDFRLIELILDIARYLRVPVVAEGVETESQLRLLREAGCDLVQGYYFSKPLPADEFARTILVRAYGTPDADPRR